MLIDQMLDKAVQDYITSMRAVGDVVYNIIVLAAAEGVIAAQNWALLIRIGPCSPTPISPTPVSPTLD